MMNKKSKKERMVDVDEEVTMLCAVRYSMGRMSYAPGAVMDYIRSRIPFMSDIQRRKIRENIQKDISVFQYLEDFEEWQKLIKNLK